MHPCQLNMLHNCRDKGMGPVADGVGFAFRRMPKEPVDQDGPVRRYPCGCVHVPRHALRVIDYFHAPAAQYIGREHHYRVADFPCNLQSLLHGSCHPGFRHGDMELVHHCPEQIPVFRQINDGWRCPEDFHPVFL